MKRSGDLWSNVHTFANLRTAALRAARGKRTTAAVAPFLDRLELAVLALQRQLAAGTWRPLPVHTFVIRDPKVRTITVTPFADQVVHHALIAILEPVFERRMIAHSYACRAGKGTHAALRQAQRQLRRHGWFLKLDVSAFFASIAHATVMTTLSRIVKDPQVLALCAQILRGSGTGPSASMVAAEAAAATQHERGLPVGSLTSQWFANLVLDRLDHEVTERLGVPGYVRYMDDFVLFADDRATLQRRHAEVEAFLSTALDLRLKDRATILAPAHQGLPFLGWQVFRGMLRVRPDNLRRYRWRLAFRRWELAHGQRSPASYRASVAAMVALLTHGNTHRLRSSWLSRDADELCLEAT